MSNWWANAYFDDDEEDIDDMLEDFYYNDRTHQRLRKDFYTRGRWLLYDSATKATTNISSRTAYDMIHDNPDWVVDDIKGT